MEISSQSTPVAWVHCWDLVWPSLNESHTGWLQRQVPRHLVNTHKAITFLERRLCLRTRMNNIHQEVSLRMLMKKNTNSNPLLQINSEAIGLANGRKYIWLLLLLFQFSTKFTNTQSFKNKPLWSMDSWHAGRLPGKKIYLGFPTHDHQSVLKVISTFCNTSRGPEGSIFERIEPERSHLTALIITTTKNSHESLKTRTSTS